VKLKQLTILLLLSSIPITALAKTAVIVHPSNTSTLTEAQIKNLFLGKSKSFSNNDIAVPICLDESTEAGAAFIHDFLKKSDSQWNAYWAQLTFTGGAVPPKKVTTAEMIALVAKNPSLIGFVDEKDVTSAIKVIYTF
jgi:hypothetical protein